MGVKVQPPSAGSGGAVFKGSWAASTAYKTGDIVLRNGRQWAARQDFTSGTSFVPSKWRMLGRYQPDRLKAASRNAIVGGPNAGLNATTTDTGMNSRVTQVARVAIGNAVLRFGNWYCGSSYDVDGPNVITVRCQIEIGSRLTPVTFDGGNLSKVIQPGATIESDPCPLDVPAGTTMFVRTFVEPRDASGSLVASGRWPVYFLNTSGFDTFTSSNGEVDKTNTTGALTNSSVAIYQPLEILAVDSPSDTPSVLVIGDSIGTTPARGSFIDLALDAAGIPFVNLSRLGDGGSNWGNGLGSTATEAKSRYRRRMLGQGTHGICEHGRNDISGAFTLGQMQTVLRGCWDVLRRHGCQWIAQTTITPKSTSTDSFATVANQTPVSSAQDTVRHQVNDWLLATALGSEIDAVFDAAALTADPVNTDVWRAGYTGDGLHHNATGAAAVAAAVDTSLIRF